MGEYSLHVYLSKKWPEGAGTSFWRHPTQGDRHDDETDIDVIQADQNDISRWMRSFTVQGRFNRAVIHDASFWHCAEPVGGWGTDPHNGRLVHTTFFRGEL
jgi:hypothetical protein